VPIRIDANALTPTKSQRRAIRVNADLSITLSPASFEKADYELFKKYLAARHGETANELGENEYYGAYVRSPVETVLARYRTADGRLIAVSYLDSLGEGLSSVYFIFDPDEAKRSLGVYSVFAEAGLLRSMGKRWYYLGFWIQDCAKMSYKGNFKPFETAKEGIWSGEITTARDTVAPD
jgi:arginine-tRNA-protein transferase